MQQPTAQSHDRRWLILCVIGIAQLMVVLDVTIVNIALPSAQQDLGFSDDGRQWVITAYALAFGSLLLLGGRIGDLFGRKWTFIAGLLGLRRRVRRSVARPTASRCSSPHARCRASSARCSRPPRSSLLTTTFTDPEGTRQGVQHLRRDRRHGRRDRPAAGRRADRVARLALVPVRLDRCSRSRRRSPVRVCWTTCPCARARGSTSSARRLASTGLFALVFGLARAETDGWGDPVTIASLAISAPLLALFVAWQRRAPQPLLPLRVVADRDRGGSFLAIGVTTAGLFGMLLFLTFYLQATKGFTRDGDRAWRSCR